MLKRLKGNFYSPDWCLAIPKIINAMFKDGYEYKNKTKRGENLPTGVILMRDGRYGAYTSFVSWKGFIYKSTSAKECHAAYLFARRQFVLELVKELERIGVMSFDDAMNVSAAAFVKFNPMLAGYKMLNELPDFTLLKERIHRRYNVVTLAEKTVIH